MSKPGVGKKLVVVTVLLVLFGVWHEHRFTMLQSWLLARYASELSAKIEPGPSDNIVFPETGPFNTHRGYTRIPVIEGLLQERGFVISEQAHFSPELKLMTAYNISAPYREPNIAGLIVKDNTDKFIYDATAELRSYKRYQDIPALIVNTLLFMEDRDLTHPVDVRNNPVINWGRFYRASLLYAAKQFGLKVPREGGSTLATQLEKFRYSRYGRTGSVKDKLNQIVSASLKVYQSGADTTLARQNIILDYLNSVPFAAAPGYGEVYGLPQAMYLWFGLEIEDITRALNRRESNPSKVSTYRKVLTMLCAIRAPSYYLIKNPSELQQRVLEYVSLLEKAGVIDADFAGQLRQVKIALVPNRVITTPIPKPLKKAVNAIRSDLVKALNLDSFYELNRLALQVETTIDQQLQNQTMSLLSLLREEEYVKQQGLKAWRMLNRGDPAQLVYSLLIYEITPLGNELRVHADTNPQAFDINRDMKLDLGSTAKLRTLVHYLEIMHQLYQQLRVMKSEHTPKPAVNAQDPLSFWARETLSQHNDLSIEAFLQRAMQREYSAAIYESFFTGGGVHRFVNFDARDNKRRITIHEATVRSVNLVYIRLMRDLVRFHKERLPYDAEALINDNDHPLRRKFLEASAEEEAKIYLKRFYQRYKGLSPESIVKKIQQQYSRKQRALAILYFTWNNQVTESGLARWLEKHKVTVSEERLAKLFRSYKQPYLKLSDYAYLLNKHPLDLWVAGQFYKESVSSWEHLLENSDTARNSSYLWLYKTRNKKAQKRRLLIKIERDAFVRMAGYWRRLGYPFARLVPSYATAIGTSADRPEALAELMGIIVNDGFQRPKVLLKKLRMAENTPYHTVFQRAQEKGQQLIPQSVAKIIRETLQETVERGTARRVKGAFKTAGDLPVATGGKTGSGDNRIKTFGKGARLVDSRAINRTATFVFFIGNRFYGVISAHVSGAHSKNYGFTSSLPVAVLKLMSPYINERLSQDNS